jgi:bacterioferritin-associated ferredoxin
MIVCSCNVFSDSEVRVALAGAGHRLGVSRVYASLGCAAQCGRCARSIKNIIDEAERKHQFAATERCSHNH